MQTLLIVIIAMKDFNPNEAGREFSEKEKKRVQKLLKRVDKKGPIKGGRLSSWGGSKKTP